MNILNTFISGLRLGDAQQYGRLTIRPVITNGDVSLPYLTLEEAIAEGTLEIVETSDAGSVPELRVINRGTKDVILIEGEELLGAKQNRLVNATTIVPAENEIMLPVTCVERGRWHHVSSRFASADRVMHPSLRKESHDAVARSLFSTARYDSDQGKVWNSVSEKAKRLGIHSPTEASSDIAEGVLRSVSETELYDEIRHEENQVGFLAFIDGGFAGGDVFGSAELCKKQLGKFTRGYYIDAMDLGLRFPVIAPEELLVECASAKQTEFAAIGKGREIRLEGKSVRGACKLEDERLSHMTVFPR